MVNMVIVNSEQCVVGTTYPHGGMQQALHMKVHIQHTPPSRHAQHKGVCRVTCVLAGLRAHYTTHAIQNKEKKKSEDEEKTKKERVVLDGGGARLADAATRHHLTPTRKREQR